jgi:hypothetical protein
LREDEDSEFRIQKTERIKKVKKIQRIVVSSNKQPVSSNQQPAFAFIFDEALQRASQ